VGGVAAAFIDGAHNADAKFTLGKISRPEEYIFLKDSESEICTSGCAEKGSVRRWTRNDSIHE
jgi:hypothetical protein